MEFPQYAVSKWIGHSITVSGRHYVHGVPDELFAKAAQKAAQSTADKGGPIKTTEVNATSGKSGTPTKTHYSRASADATNSAKMEAEGIEPSSQDNRNGGLYMLIWCFDLDPADEHQHPSAKSSRLYLIA
jgi:hypothetical protein